MGESSSLFGNVRAFTTMYCEVAVPTQDAIARWVFVLPQPAVCLSSSSMPLHSSLSASPAVDVVESQEDQAGLATACASGCAPAVGTENVQPQFVSFASGVLADFIGMFPVVLGNDFCVSGSICVGHVGFIS
jgi:hypothetical protein